MTILLGLPAPTSCGRIQAPRRAGCKRTARPEHAPGPERRAVLSRMGAAARGLQDTTLQRSEPRQGELSGLGGQMTVTGVSGGTLCSPPARSWLWHITFRSVHGQIVHSPVGRGTGRSYPQANRCFPPSRGGLSQVMGTIALCWRSREPPPCARVMRETGLLAPHRVGRTAAKPTMGRSLSTRSMKCGEQT